MLYKLNINKYCDVFESPALRQTNEKRKKKKLKPVRWYDQKDELKN